MKNRVPIRAELTCAVFSLLVVWLEPAIAEEQANDIKREFFEKRIRPVLVQSCYKCHSSGAKKIQGGLRLDSRAGLLKGGESGPAIIPGKPQESLLISALRYDSFQMPPINRLPDEVINDFTKWIQDGATDPRDKPDRAAQGDPWPTILASRKDWWSLKPVKRPAVPQQHEEWAQNEIDRFVLERLRAKQLKPQPTAEPIALLRRLTLVLTGLPPDVADVQSFVEEYHDNADLAYRRVVERLLQSPRFGERWARHWMDVVRFTETHGNEWNYEVHHAWRYRDYLVRAFNQDVPFDQLVMEHIAGDLLDQPRWNKSEQLNESKIGTAFFRFGEVNHDDCVGLVSLGYDVLDNQIDTLTKAFQATTVACARCHHHKMDAVSMYDYYGLLGILKSSRLMAHTLDADDVNAKSIQTLRAAKTKIRQAVAQHWLEQVDSLAEYLLAADAKHRKLKSADQLAKGLDKKRLAAWVKVVSDKSPAPEHPIWPWRNFSTVTKPQLPVADRWEPVRKSLLDSYAERNKARQTDFETYADFRSNQGTNLWVASGQGMQNRATGSGELVVATDGDHVVASILPAGRFTHTESSKLNGTIRSQVLPANKKYISVQVLGDKTSAFRLVSNNCQLNYINYRALTSPDPVWVTFPIPESSEELRTFAELVTKYNNPKFPDQLGTLGGDRTNDRIPWRKAATDPRSYFGIMQAVFHKTSKPPQADLSPTKLWFEGGKAPADLNDVADRYVREVRKAITAWKEGRASDHDVYWLSWIARNGLLDHSTRATPEIERLVAEYRQLENTGIRRPRVSAGIGEGAVGFNHPVLDRGDYRKPGKPTQRRYLEVLGHVQPPNKSKSGRLELAEAIASSDNPLTARVYVNRIWHHLFGTGIVKTVDDFGRVGEQPSHPKLLDYLASRFASPVGPQSDGMGWQTKRLIREIVLSQTFRTTNRMTAESQTQDPENRLLHYYPARRLDAEAIRDSLLHVSGRLRNQMFGFSIDPYREATNADRRLFAGPLDGNGRRSLYIKTNLMEGPKFLSAFNIPGGKIVQGRRDVTNVPLQALTLMNDPFVLQQVEVWADRVIQKSSESVEARINRMFRRALLRSPSQNEQRRFNALITQLAQLHAVRQNDILSNKLVWKDVAHVLCNMKEFIYIP